MPVVTFFNAVSYTGRMSLVLLRFTQKIVSHLFISYSLIKKNKNKKKNWSQNPVVLMSNKRQNNNLHSEIQNYLKTITTKNQYRAFRESQTDSDRQTDRQTDRQSF